MFKLDEASIVERLEDIERSSRGHMRWVDNSGLRQIQRISQIVDPLLILSATHKEEQKQSDA